MILCIRRDPKSKFRKPRTLVRPVIHAVHAFLATGATHEQTD
jgi:hypothetical protein